MTFFFVYIFVVGFRLVTFLVSFIFLPILTHYKWKRI